MASPVPAPPQPPRLEILVERAELGPDLVTDDAVISETRFATSFADSHRSEFVEIGACEVLGGSLAQSEWYRSNWYDLSLQRVDLASSRHVETGWRRVALRECRATGLDLGTGVLTDVEVENTTLDLANLRFAKLQRVRFTGCRLRGTDFGSARFSDVSFVDCDLSEADFHQARSQRVTMTGCQLDGLRNVAGLAGMTIAPVDLLQFSAQLAQALGIELA